jgi:hypothetical protein
MYPNVGKYSSTMEHMGLGFCCGCRFISGLFVQSAEKNLHKSAAQAEESSIAQDIPEVVKKPLMQVEFAG